MTRRAACPLKKKKRNLENRVFARAENRKGAVCKKCGHKVSQTAGHYRFVDGRLVVLCDEHLREGSMRG